MVNDIVGMRLSPDVVAKMDACREATKWMPGQVVAELLEMRERQEKFKECFRIGVERDGSELVYVWDPETKEVIDVLDSPEAHETLLLWIVNEMGKPFWEAFKAPYPTIEELYS